MNKKAAVGLALGVLIGSAAIWLRKPNKTEPVDVPSAADTMPLFKAAPVSVPASVPSAPSNEERSPDVARAKSPERVFPTDLNPGAGFYNKHMTADFEIYLQFMDAAVYSEIVNGRMAHEQLLQNMKAQFELTDEELEQLIEVGRPTLESDRAFQAAGMEAICKKGRTFATVAELGAALDEMNKGFEANQEELGRKAMQQLEPLLAAKIRNKILNSPRREMMTGDLAVVMPRRNHGLEVEIGRVCNFGK